MNQRGFAIRPWLNAPAEALALTHSIEPDISTRKVIAESGGIMRASLIAMITVCLAQSTWSQQPPPATEWTGVWKPENIQYNGKSELTDAGKDQIRLVIKGNEYRVFLVTDHKEMLGKRIATATLTFDPAKKTFELEMQEGLKKAEKLHGIYEIKNQTMKLCYGPASQDRPKSFAAPEGSNVFCETWSCEKK